MVLFDPETRITGHQQQISQYLHLNGSGLGCAGQGSKLNCWAGVRSAKLAGWEVPRYAAKLSCATGISCKEEEFSRRGYSSGSVYLSSEGAHSANITKYQYWYSRAGYLQPKRYGLPTYLGRY